jgi:cytochrome P450
MERVVEDSSRRVEPPAPIVHARPLPAWRVIAAMLGNPLTVYSRESFTLPVGRVRILGRTSIAVNHPDGVKHVLTSHAARYGRPAAAIRPVRWMMGNGLLLAEGEAWRGQRRMLAPLFSPAHIGALLPHFLAAGQALDEGLSGRSEAKLSEAFNQATLDAVLRALFSTPAATRGRELASLTHHYLMGPGRPNFGDMMAQAEGDFAMFDGSRRRFRTKWHQAVDAFVRARREEGHEGGSRDLLDILLAARDPETGAALSPEEVRDQSATMIFAGFETTARLLFWAAYLLALDQREQARVRAEVAAFPPERVGSLQDLQHWSRLKCVLLEALRLYPPVAQLIRQAVAPDEVLGEQVAVGDLIWISPWTLQRHRDHWTDPTAFMPERFEGQPQPWGNGAFIPFGGGPRICIGASFALAEAQILMASLLNGRGFGLVDTRPVLPIGRITTVPSYEPRFSLRAGA